MEHAVSHARMKPTSVTDRKIHSLIPSTEYVNLRVTRAHKILGFQSRKMA